MEKVKLTKEQAEAIESAQEDIAKERVVDIFVRDGSKFTGNCEIINEFGLDALIRALYIGYEVELTEQERVDGLFCKIKSIDYNPFIQAQTYYTQGIVDTLEALGRKDLIPKDGAK